MIESNIDIRSIKQINDEIEAALLRRALYFQQEKEISALKEEYNGAIDTIITRNRSKVRILIRKEYAHQKVNHLTKYTMPRLGKLAAVLFLVFFIGLATALATMPSVRITAVEFLINIEKEHSRIGIRKGDGEDFSVPSSWQGDYFLTYIPNGFHMNSMINMLGLSSAYLVTDDGRELDFTEGDEATNINIDTEDSTISVIPINGSPGILSEKKGRVFVVWSEREKYFIVKYDGMAKEALAIAESVSRIK